MLALENPWSLARMQKIYSRTLGVIQTLVIKNFVKDIFHKM